MRLMEESLLWTWHSAARATLESGKAPDASLMTVSPRVDGARQWNSPHIVTQPAIKAWGHTLIGVSTRVRFVFQRWPLHIRRRRLYALSSSHWPPFTTQSLVFLPWICNRRRARQCNLPPGLQNQQSRVYQASPFFFGMLQLFAETNVTDVEKN